MKRMITRVITCFFLFGASLIQTVFAAHTVNLIPVTIEEMQSTTTAAELDKLLYPSGMQLPTKYMDFFMFAEASFDAVTVSDETAQLLEDWFPVSNNSYTWAECVTAELYTWLYRQMYTSVREDAPASDLNVMRNVLTENGYSFVGETTTGTLTGISTLQETIETYKDFLKMDIGSTYLEQAASSKDLETGVVLTIGPTVLWDCTDFSAPAGMALQDRVNWLETRPQYNALLGVMLESGGPVLHPESTVISESSSSTNNQSVGYVASFNPGYTAVMVEDRELGPRDMLTTVCLVLVVFVVIVLGIVDFWRKRNDPMRKWRWP